ncbi:hypothetical protein VNO80_21341 [Phaseolus coccineus]|uniref:Uncharacterized protein n=1 Tax=Phaseolus coccineus TaxID=3886 RepID=A0AAN9QXL8_PHACN
MPQLITDAFPLDLVPAIRITGKWSASFIAEGGGLGNYQPRQERLETWNYLHSKQKGLELRRGVIEQGCDLPPSEKDLSTCSCASLSIDRIRGDGDATA